MITGTDFVDLSVAYHTVNHRLSIQNLLNITQDCKLCKVIQNLLSNSRFYVSRIMNEDEGDYRKMACHKGVFSPHLFSIYTPMIIQSIMEQGASSMQMTWASQPSSLPSHK